MILHILSMILRISIAAAFCLGTEFWKVTKLSKSLLALRRTGSVGRKTHRGVYAKRFET